MRRERRQNFRVEWNSAGEIELGDGGPALLCIVANLSNGGAKIGGVIAATLPDEFMLSLVPGVEPARKCRVTWRADNELGVRFAEAQAPARKPSRKVRVDVS
jgi:hypothetical protein